MPRGIAEYQNTLKQKNRPKNPPPPKKEEISGLPERSFTKEGSPKTPLQKAGLKGLLKTEAGKATSPSRKIPPIPPSASPAGSEEDSKYRRVAKFLILIGGDEAARIISRLEPEQVEAITREIASIRGITSEEADLILEEFRSLLAAPYGFTGVSFGGVETARRILYAAFGPDKGESFLKKTAPQEAENPFDFLKDFSGGQLALLFREENAAAEALVLSRLPSSLSAAVLANTVPERKLEIVRRIAHSGQTAPEVLEQIAAALREKARHLGRPDTAAPGIDGMNVLTAILKHADIAFGDRLLEELTGDDPGLGRDLKERLYTLEDVVNAEDRPLQEKLRSMSDRDIALLLKGRSEAFAQKIYADLSSGRQSRIREEIEIMGPVSKKDADAAARNFLAWFRLNLEEGRILLLDEDDIV
jgi:flagellar motor switch protein FliG